MSHFGFEAFGIPAKDGFTFAKLVCEELNVKILSSVFSMRWEVWLNGRAFAQHAQGSEFSPQYHYLQKKKLASGHYAKCPGTFWRKVAVIMALLKKRV